jgi:uncharacterized protein YndB with AHSA1/START domain
MRHLLPVLAAALILAAPARAEVVQKSEAGFVSRNTVEVAATPEAVWSALVQPKEWWNKAHTYSGDAANLSIDPVAGGCFCETIPVVKGAPVWQRPGGVEHMRVINVMPGEVLRMTGALGPLQSEAVHGVLTITIKKTDKGTRILFEYVVGGYMRYPVDQISGAVDKVMLEQIGRLALKVDPTATGRGTLSGPPAPAKPAGPPLPADIKPAPKAAPLPTAAPNPELLKDAPKLEARPDLMKEPAKPAQKLVPAPLEPVAIPPAGSPLEAEEKAKGAEAAAALDALTAPKAATKLAKAEPAAAAPLAYATRTLLLLDPAKPGEWVDEARKPVSLAFLGGAEAKLAAQLAAAKDPANKGKAAICSCTGRLEMQGGKETFLVLDGTITFR